MQVAESPQDIDISHVYEIAMFFRIEPRQLAETFLVGPNLRALRIPFLKSPFDLRKIFLRCFLDIQQYFYIHAPSPFLSSLSRRAI